MIFLLVGGAALVGLLEFLAPASSESAGPVEAVSGSRLDAAEVEPAGGRADKAPTPDPAAFNLLAALAHRTTDGPPGPDLFAPHSWYVAPPPPPPRPPPPPPEPTAPALPYTLLGSYTGANEQTVYYLTRDDRVYDVRVGDTLDNDYSVDGVENGQLVFTYKPMETRQTLPLGEAP